MVGELTSTGGYALDRDQPCRSRAAGDRGATETRAERLSHAPAHRSIVDRRTWLESLEVLHMRRVTRREMLRLAQATGVGLLGVALSACAPGAAPASTTSSQPLANSAPAQATAAPAAWDQLVAAAQKEGKIVVSGPPVPDARTKMPAAFKQRFNIEMDYLAVNPSQLASRIETERAAGQYPMDVSLGGPDTVYATFLVNKWLDPLKPALILPEVLDPKAWPTGGPWFRDPSGEMSLQLFNTIIPIGYINTSSVSPDELKTTDDLLNPKWKGKIASYDPSVNGGGLIFGSVGYIVKGDREST